MNKKTTVLLQITSTIFSWSFAIWFIYSFIISDKLEMTKYVGSFYLLLIKILLLGIIIFILIFIFYMAPVSWLDGLSEKINFDTKWEKILFKIIINIIIFALGVGMYCLLYYFYQL